MHHFTRLALISCLCFSTLSQSAFAVDYAKNQREDRGVWISFVVGSIVFVGTFIPGVYFLAPQGAYNMQPYCPTANPAQCCDPSSNPTLPPTNCVAPTGLNCVAPKVAYCTGNSVPAGFTHQNWALQAGIPLVVVAGIGFLAATIGASVGCCCFGTCGFGFT